MPRFTPQETQDSVNFSSASANDGTSNPSFSLSSSTCGARRQTEPRTWSAISSSYSGSDDDYALSANGVTNYGQLEAADPTFSLPMLSSVSAFNCDNLYDVLAEDVLSAHGPLEMHYPPSQYQSQELNQDMIQSIYMSPDLAQYQPSSMVDNPYSHGIPWQPRPLSPPPESYVTRHLFSAQNPSDEGCPSAKDGPAMGEPMSSDRSLSHRSAMFLYPRNRPD